MSIFNENDRKQRKLSKIATKIEAREEYFRNMSDEELAGMTAKFRERLAAGETLDDLLVDAFATVREASSRVLNMRHFHVQLMGGVALYQGRIAEMATGEGKTLVATLPAYLVALAGKGVHIVTVNEYLAKRDAEWMGKIYRFLKLSVGVIVRDMTNAQKRAAYNCDITYCTNSELGFDYLRDNMAVKKENLMQRELNFAIIDEVDSILIDEARTPLIISTTPEVPTEDLVGVARFVAGLKEVVKDDEQEDEDYEDDEEQEEKEKSEGEQDDDENEPEGDCEVDYEKRTVLLTEQGIRKAEKHFGVEDLFTDEAGSNVNAKLYDRILTALKARYLFLRDRDYLVSPDKKVVIIDHNTGRAMPGRRYSDGLHQAIEAKESLLDKRVRILGDNKLAATITYQNLFRQYKRISGMTGTAKTEEAEFKDIYKLDVVCISPNLPCKRKDHNDKVFLKKEKKFDAVVADIKLRHEKGQPLLIGTTSVEESEYLSKRLKECKIEHTVLNAKQDGEEAKIIAQAGTPGAVTISTNMAGRGTDILLGGNPEILASVEIEKLLKKEFEDKFLAGVRREEQELKNRRKHSLVIPERDADSELLESKTAYIKQLFSSFCSMVTDGLAVKDEYVDNVTDKSMAADILQLFGIDLRKVIDDYKEKYKYVLAEENALCAERKKQVVASGGLCVIGTGRNESRRIDNQLRGRAGRQGDPGESVYYVALDDELFRYNNQEKLTQLLGKLNMMLPAEDRDAPLEYSFISKFVLNTQKRIEGNFFVQRRDLLYYDEVLEVQRRTIYDVRRAVLLGEDKSAAPALPTSEEKSRVRKRKGKAEEDDSEPQNIDVHAEILKMMRRLAETIADKYVKPSVGYDEWDIEKFEDEIEKRMLPGALRTQNEQPAEEPVPETTRPNDVAEDENDSDEAYEVSDDSYDDEIDQEELPVKEELESRMHIFREGGVLTEELCQTSDKQVIVDAIVKRALSEYESKTKFYASKGFDYEEEECLALLHNIDMQWPDFLDRTSGLKEGIRLRAYGQHDPRIVFRKESMDMFDELIDRIYTSTAEMLLTTSVPAKFYINKENMAEVMKAQLYRDIEGLFLHKDWEPSMFTLIKQSTKDEFLYSLVGDVAEDIVSTCEVKTEDGATYDLAQIDALADRVLLKRKGENLMISGAKSTDSKEDLVKMLREEAWKQFESEFIRVKKKLTGDIDLMIVDILHRYMDADWRYLRAYFINKSKFVRLVPEQINAFLDENGRMYEMFYKRWSADVVKYLCVSLDAESKKNAGKSVKFVEQRRVAQGAPGRNDPCPCGSGKKYKNCCGRAVTGNPSNKN